MNVGDQSDSCLSDLVARLRLVGADAQTIEVKAAARQMPRSVLETLSAFANGSGGLVLLGLDEEAGFTPVAGFRATAVREALASACSDRLQPPLRPLIELLPFEGGVVVLARIEPLAPFEKPCFVRDRGIYGGSYIRTGDGDRHLTQYEIDRLREEQRQPVWDEELVSQSSPGDLDPVGVDQLFARQRRLRPQLFGSGTAEDVLLRLRVLGRDDAGRLHPTLAGLLALGSYPQEYFPRLNVTVAVFPGETKAPVLTGAQRMLDSASLVGPIPALVGDAVSMVVRNSRTGARIDGAYRVDVPDYPAPAVREAVTNALMHRDLSPAARGTQVQVNLYSDRLEVLNPGGLFGAVTIAGLGRPGISSSRNQRLSTVLEDVAYRDGGMVAENRGSGYQAIEAALSAQGMGPPVPRDDIATFSLTMYRRAVTAAVPGPRERLSEALRRAGVASSAALASTLGLSRSAVNTQLRALIGSGVVRALEPTRSRNQRYEWVGEQMA